MSRNIIYTGKRETQFENLFSRVQPFKFMNGKRNKCYTQQRCIHGRATLER